MIKNYFYGKQRKKNIKIAPFNNKMYISNSITHDEINIIKVESQKL